MEIIIVAAATLFVARAKIPLRGIEAVAHDVMRLDPIETRLSVQPYQRRCLDFLKRTDSAPPPNL